MRAPRFLLLSACVALTAAAYYLILFTNGANPYRGGSYRGAVITDAVAVLAVFSCVEVFRTEKIVAVRAVAAAVAVPLVLVILFIVWYGLQRYVAA